MSDYRQCKLMRNTPWSSSSRIAIIPAASAIEGQSIQLRDLSVWSEPWTIAWVRDHCYDSGIPAQDVRWLPTVHKQTAAELLTTLHRQVVTVRTSSEKLAR